MIGPKIKDLEGAKMHPDAFGLKRAYRQTYRENARKHVTNEAHANMSRKKSQACPQHGQETCRPPQICKHAAKQKTKAAKKGRRNTKDSQKLIGFGFQRDS